MSFARKCYVLVTMLALALPLAGRAQILINEIMAANLATAPLADIPDYFPDYVELYNYSTNDIDLFAEGWTLTDDVRFPTKFRFPPGSFIAADSFLLVFCDAETNLLGAAGTLHTGFNLDAKGGEILALYRTNVTLGTATFICSNQFGIQVPGYSVGRVPSGSGEPNSSANFTLNHPTPCGVPYPIPSQACLPNIAASFVPAPSSSNQFTLKINEWQATNSAGVDRDWIELYNPDTNVVALSGLVFTDNRVQLIGFIRAVPPLSYIAPQGYVQFFASDLASRDANHLDFSLSSGSDDPPPTPGNPLDRIFLFAPGRNIAHVVDMVDCYLWRGRNLSEGRVPDGESRIIVFPNPTPEDSNFGRITNVVIHELISHTDPPLEDAVKFYNPTTQPVDISHWWLSNSRGNPRKYQFPSGTIVPALGYYVAYEHQFNNTNLNPTTAFTFNSARGDECYLFSANSAGTITGFRTGVAFGPADNGVSFVRHVTSDTNVEFVASQDLAFGTDVRAGQDPARLALFRTGQGALNAPALISPIVINEIHYHPPDFVQGTNRVDNADDEFVELRNIASVNVPLFYAPREQTQQEFDFATNGWRLRGLVDFDFPGLGSGQHVMVPNSYALVVNFDPDNPTNAQFRAQFMARFGIPAGTKLFGPYKKRLSNNRGDVELRRPDRPQLPPHPDAGITPYVLMDRVSYKDNAPWPTNGVDGFGNSLQRRYSYEFGNEPTNWLGAAPTAGRFNSPSGLEAPYILVQPRDVGLVEPGVSVQFTCLARGENPISYRWHRNGVFTGVTGTNLSLPMVGSLQSGGYTCVISNAGGITTSLVARVDVNCPFFLNHSLAGFPIAGGSSNIVVSGTNGCEWTVENVPDWITITSGPTYNGSGIVTYTVAPNNLGLRSATLLVAGLPYVIGQTPGDLIRPTVSVTAPATGARLTSSQVLVRGTANDNVKIGSLAGAVTVEVLGGSIRQIDGSNVWSTLVSLPAPGTNWIRVYSQDFAGNYSATNTRTVFYAVSAPLTLNTSGAGRVTGATNFQRLDIGRNYTLTATPAAGHVFSYWSRQGIPISHSNRLTFRMEAGLQLGAHFVPSPYGAVRGTYDGLFLTPGDVHHTNAGSFKMITTERGTYTVTIQLAGKRYAASGQFLLNASAGSLPSATNVIARPGLTPLTVAWYLDLIVNPPGFGSDTVTGWMSMQESAFPVNVIGNRATYHAVTNRAPLAGKYTLVIPGAPGATDRPQGDGFGTVTIAPSGLLTFSGTLADGTPVTHSAPVSKNGEWPLNVTLHAGKGSLLGWVYFATNDPQTDLFGDVVWTRPALATTPFYRPGFEASSRLIGSRYVAPVGATSRILAITNGLVIVTGGNLSQAYTNDVILGLGSRVTNASPNRLTLTFAPATGLFTGSFTPAGTTRAYALRGVALQKPTPNFASGFFFGTNEVGRVSFEPVPPPLEFQ